MRIIKPFLAFLFFALVATIILSMLLPTRQRLERSVTINAPAALVYEQLAKLEHFNHWSLWTSQDSTATYTLTGTDGTVGATSAWKGDPSLSGEGKMEIIFLDPGKKVEQVIHFIQPKKRNARSVFTLSERGGTTIVTWNFELATPRPWNIYNLFYSMDKERGKDFEGGLAALKKIVETKAGTVSKEIYEVTPMNFPATRFATIRQQIKWSDLLSFYQQHLPLLIDEAAKATLVAGTPSAICYDWNEKEQLADIATAVPVPAGSKIENTIVNMLDIPASKAVYINYYGAYDRVSDAYSSVKKYLEANKLKHKQPVIQQFITGPAQEIDTAKWLTKIVFLVE